MIVEECVHAYQSVLVSTPANSAYQTLGMDSEIVDSDGFHDNATNNERLTFASGGIFLVFGSPTWNNPASGNANGRLRKNGTSVGYEYNTSGFAAHPTSLCGPILFWLEDFDAGDYMDSQGWSDAGGNRDAWTQMCALKVSEWSCHVGSTTFQSAPAFGSTTLLYPTVIYDPHGMATATDRIECQEAGYYLVLTNANGESTTKIHKNGSVTALHGSTGGGGDGQGRNAADYVVDWFEVGDYVQCILYSNDRSLGAYDRQFAMIYLGDEQSAVAYTYADFNITNADPGFITGILRTNTEWFDVGHGHPRNGFQYNASPVYCTTCGSFNMLDGYHFALAKIASSGGFFVNDAVYTVLNGSQLGQVFPNTRHVGFNTRMGFACFSAVYGDTFTANWVASTLNVFSATTPETNVFVTDASQWSSQFYRRR